MTAERDFEDVPGWFAPVDRALFEWILCTQSEHNPPGGLAEVGVYLGKSAIHIGRFRQPTENFTVCDLFDLAGTEARIPPGVRDFYSSLRQEAFEENYRAFHAELPTVVRGFSNTLESHVAPGSLRFIHIDASHLYQHVRQDALMARRLLRPDGVVAFDDYRTEHTIGTAAAVWETVVRDGLRPVCATPMKFYATWGDPRWLQEALLERLSYDDDHVAEVHDLFDTERILRIVRVADDRSRARRVLARLRAVSRGGTPLGRRFRTRRARTRSDARDLFE